MISLIIPLFIEFVCFGFSAWMKFEVDPDMGIALRGGNDEVTIECRELRRNYILGWWLKLIVTVALTATIWWFWHPITHEIQNFHAPVRP